LYLEIAKVLFNIEITLKFPESLILDRAAAEIEISTAYLN
jgi:hypothetical protein